MAELHGLFSWGWSDLLDPTCWDDALTRGPQNKKTANNEPEDSCLIYSPRVAGSLKTPNSNGGLFFFAQKGGKPQFEPPKVEQHQHQRNSIPTPFLLVL